MRPRVWLAAVAVGLGLSPAVADDPPKTADLPKEATAEPKTLAEKVAALKKQSDAAQRTYFDTATKLQKEIKGQDRESAESKAANAKIESAYEAWMKTNMEVGGKLAVLAKENPKDPAAIFAVQSALQMDRRGDNRKVLLGIVAEHHLNSFRLANLIGDLMYDDAADTKTFLKTVSEKAPNPTAKGAALYAIGFQLKQQLTRYGKPATDEEFAEIAPQVEKVLGEVVEKYGEVKAFGNTTLGKQATAQLAGVKNIPLLRVGKVAPEVEGEDIDGKPFKLSDYRGKVVMIDFWGDW